MKGRGCYYFSLIASGIKAKSPEFKTVVSLQILTIKDYSFLNVMIYFCYYLGKQLFFKEVSHAMHAQLTIFLQFYITTN